MARVWGPIAVSMLVAWVSVPATASPTDAAEYGPLATVPDQLIGRWQMVGERCEDEAAASPRQVSVILRLDRSFRYELSVEGWRSVGIYRIDRFRDSPLRLQLADTLYNFDLVDNRLENWGEGDAPFLCGRIFEREK